MLRDAVDQKINEGFDVVGREEGVIVKRGTSVLLVTSLPNHVVIKTYDNYK